jgi:hypothetical protein
VAHGLAGTRERLAINGAQPCPPSVPATSGWFGEINSAFHILDSGSSLHVSWDLSRFLNFRKALISHYAVCSGGQVTILGYGELDVSLTNEKGRKRLLRLYNVALYIVLNSRPTWHLFCFLRSEELIGPTVRERSQSETTP